MAGKRAPRAVVPVSLAEIRLPAVPFLYTLDQVAILINVSVKDMPRRCHFIGRTLGPAVENQIQCMNIAQAGDAPEWRISEGELLRWLIRHGYKPVRYQY